ncbi:MAG TPA: hypothetical protein VF538_11010 [Pyrinomonadaceae bacterium]|jgi:hypothetical protein
MKRRVLNSVAITLISSLALGAGAWLIVAVLGWEIPERVVTILGYLSGWPLLLLGPFIPASDSPAPHAAPLRNVLYLMAVLLDLAAYSLLIYFIRSWIVRRGASRRLYDRVA